MPSELATLLEVCGVSLFLLLAVVGLAIRRSTRRASVGARLHRAAHRSCATP